MTLRLDDEEIEVRDQLAKRYGIDGSGVLRQALRRWGLAESINPAPQPAERPASPRKKTTQRSK